MGPMELDEGPQPSAPPPGAGPQVAMGLAPPPEQYPQWRTMSAGPTKDWDSGVCDCCENLPLFLDVWLCGSCQLARQAAVVLEGRPDDANWPFCLAICCGTCVLSRVGIGGMVPCVTNLYLRDNMRKDLNLTGSFVGDAALSCFCLPCVLWQQHRELSARGLTPGVVCCGRPHQRGVQHGYGAL
eukprot:Hpha_TRINITY_DN16445_c2_g1::TRINITY_DN16445_c2_g1_i1::g.159025::m.159025